MWRLVVKRDPKRNARWECPRAALINWTKHYGENYLVVLALRNCPAAMASKMLLLPTAGTELASLNCGRSRGAGRGLRGFEAYIDERP